MNVSGLKPHTQRGFTIVELLIVIVVIAILAANMSLGGLKKGNPWGAKYYIDENELENMSDNNGCNKDGIGVGSNVPSGTTGINTPVIPTYTC